MFKSITTSRRYTNRTLVSLMPCVSPSRWPHVYFHYTNTASSIILHLNSSTLPWRNCSLWSVQFSTLFLPSRPFPSCWSRLSLALSHRSRSWHVQNSTTNYKIRHPQLHSLHNGRQDHIGAALHHARDRNPDLLCFTTLQSTVSLVLTTRHDLSGPIFEDKRTTTSRGYRHGDHDEKR